MNTFFTLKSQPWYLVLGFQVEEPVDLKITCPDQSTVPGYSTTLLPFTTVPAPVARTVTVTIKSKGSDLGFARTAVTTTTIKSEESNSGLATDLGDEKSSGDTVLMFFRFPYLRLSIM